MDDKYKKGQYFTTNEFLQSSLFKLIRNNPNIILEPSVGRGDLVKYVKEHNEEIIFHTYEIDESLDIYDCVDNIIYGDFLKENIESKYKTIIGNPPYVKKKGGGNLYIDFIKKCYQLLEDKGELIFIVPSDFIKLSGTSDILNEMLENGTITDIIHPNNEKLFKEASVDIIIFRYCKDQTLNKKVMLNGIEKHILNTNGILTFTDNLERKNTSLISDYFNVYVGIVSGKEDVFKNDKFGNITVLNNKNKEDKYILIDKFPTSNIELNEYMNNNKECLISRKIRRFTEKNWFEWGALRNIKHVEQNLGKKCIYMYNMTRNKEVAFIDTVKYFGGNLIMLLPKDDNVDLNKFVNYLNSDTFKSNYMYSGRFKIGHKQICNITI